MDVNTTSQIHSNFSDRMDALLHMQERATRKQTLLDVSRSLRRQGYSEAADRVLEWDQQ